MAILHDKITPELMRRSIDMVEVDVPVDLIVTKAKSYAASVPSFGRPWRENKLTEENFLFNETVFLQKNEKTKHNFRFKSLLKKSKIFGNPVYQDAFAGCAIDHK